jgi:NAD(P)-dependent dehydrogenase (short-subunit alcohol dehydrogenase family)
VGARSRSPWTPRGKTTSCGCSIARWRQAPASRPPTSSCSTPATTAASTSASCPPRCSRRCGGSVVTAASWWGREAARRLVPLGRGTLIFTGASASLRGKPGYAQFAASKAGLRAIAQSMAREYGPLGIHVAHVIVDGAIDGQLIRDRFPQAIERLGEDGLLGIEAIADAYWHLHRQHRSAWTHEIDLRPFKESF